LKATYQKATTWNTTFDGKVEAMIDAKLQQSKQETEQLIRTKVQQAVAEILGCPVAGSWSQWKTPSLVL